MDITSLRAELAALKSSGAWTRIAALGGISYFTLQRIVKDESRMPEPLTVARIATGLRKYRKQAQQAA